VKQKKDVLQGTWAWMVLKTLDVLGPQDGYIARRIEQAAYLVTGPRKESGMRMAPEAQRKEVFQAALERAFKLLAFGSTAGWLILQKLLRGCFSRVYRCIDGPVALGMST
jgi:hypothetical protein